MDKSVNGSLLVIGNGFDLNCGLESSFSSFIGHVKKESNLWYLLFDFVYDKLYIEYENQTLFKHIEKDNILWMDVEDFIKRVLFMHHPDDKKYVSRLLSAFGVDTYIGVIISAFNNRNNSQYLYNNLQFCLLKEFFKKRFNSLPSKKINMLSFLYDELVSFENEFKEYIKSLTDNNEAYLNKTKTILSAISSGEEAFDILSFNYTHPAKDAINLLAYGNINNIHGSVNANIIIGYDAGDVDFKSNDEKLKMSKMWQKMFCVFSPSYLPERNQISSLKIYGHSLGEQDYSYFYSLFDFYDIYNSKVVLIFYYTPYKDSKEENAIVLEKYVASIYRLLNSYMSKTQNGSKGNIVANKLVLENRLRILVVDKLS